MAVTPLDRIVVETDAPYLTPVPFRGKRNDSSKLPYVIEKLAEWKGISAEEMERITYENGKRLLPTLPVMDSCHSIWRRESCLCFIIM